MKLLSSCSARPNFVKLAAIQRAIEAQGNNDIEHVIVHTGQHYDPLFSDIFFTQLSLPMPAYNLGIKATEREEVIDQTATGFEKVLRSVQPDAVLVYGDVNGAVGAARAAKKLGIPLAHVEAGLRSFDRAMPEELNRIEIDQLANVLLCSEEAGIKNLADEGLADHAVLVGNTMIDTLIRMLPLIDQEMLPGDVHRPYAVCTLHRPSNVDTVEALTANMEFLREMSERIPVILPVHHRLRLALRDFDLELPAGVIALPPLGYLPFLRLVRDASFIVTDSGGIQEEATYLKKRCFTLRLNTERPSSVVSGSNSLINLAKKDDRDLVLAYADAPVEPHVLVPPLWDGHAGERILAALHASFAR